MIEIPDQLVITVMPRMRMGEHGEGEETGEQGETQAGGFHAAI